MQINLYTCKISKRIGFLNEDNKNYIEPDISVICDNRKLNDKGCNGAPDWIIEIVSKLLLDLAP